jgi:hypothetical protein
MAIAHEHSLELNADSDLGAPHATMGAIVDTERLVKSVERVRDLGEVFTPSATVEEMLDLLPADVWTVHPSPTFFEPACGDGNFLVAVLARKLDSVELAFKSRALPAGVELDAAQFHALEALSSIYAVDISVDNVIGGTPGHEKGARTRLLDVIDAWHERVLGNRLRPKSGFRTAAEWIVNHNVLVGNMLSHDALGNPTNRRELPLIEYGFEATNGSVEVKVVPLGDVLAAQEQQVSGAMTLFGPVEPEVFWRGQACRLAKADAVAPPTLSGPARNGVRR